MLTAIIDWIESYQFSMIIVVHITLFDFSQNFQWRHCLKKISTKKHLLSILKFITRRFSWTPVINLYIKKPLPIYFSRINCSRIYIRIYIYIHVRDVSSLHQASIFTIIFYKEFIQNRIESKLINRERFLRKFDRGNSVLRIDTRTRKFVE